MAKVAAVLPSVIYVTLLLALMQALMQYIGAHRCTCTLNWPACMEIVWLLVVNAAPVFRSFRETLQRSLCFRFSVGNKCMRMHTTR